MSKEYNLGRVTGYSAYEVAVESGFEGSVTEWLKSLQGDAFAYEDFTDEQLASLQGEAFAYEDFTEEQLAGLKGETGSTSIASTLLVEQYDGTVNMSSGVYYVYTPYAESIELSLEPVAEGALGIYAVQIKVGDTTPVLIYPSDLIWDFIPEFIANATYEINIVGVYASYKIWSDE